jgi:hypothetical protein
MSLCPRAAKAACFMVAAWLCLGPARGGVVTIYVAPTGSDRWSGRLPLAKDDGSDGPLATLPAALEKTRAARATDPDGTARIVLRGGLYVLDRPLVILPEDSRLAVTAYPREKPVISGETRVTGWRYLRVNPNVWQARAPWAAPFHELFVNGRRRQRARFPVSGFFQGAPVAGSPTQVRFRPGEIKGEWGGEGGVELVAYQAWSQTRNEIRNVTEASAIASLAGDVEANKMEHTWRYYLENVPDVLRPGEWCLDRRTGTVRYWPTAGEDVPSARITAPHLDQLVRLEGEQDDPVEEVTFRGLVFAETDWRLDGGSDVDGQAAATMAAAFQARWAKRCAIEECVFTRLGGYAIDLGHGCQQNRISGCAMFDLGGGGVRLGEGDAALAAAGPNFRNSVTDNHIHHIGLVNAPAVGVLVLLSSSNGVAHNEIDHTFYTTISVGWSWGYAGNACCGNVIEFNLLHDIGQGLLSDMGGVYTLGVQPGTVVRNNVIHDVNAAVYGAWGLYTDEGSSDIVLESNIVYRCQAAGFHQHYGESNLVRNNIFALNHDAQLAHTRPERHVSFIFSNNIVYFDSGRLLSGTWSGDGFVMDHNIYFDTRVGPSHRPLDGELKFQAWREMGHDLDSEFIDPLFVNPAEGDFRLRAGSPARRFGIHAIDARTVGVRPGHLAKPSSN